MSDVSRRTIVAGTAWAVPAIAVATAAPAMAASPATICAGIEPGQPLPASAFEVTYLCIRSESFGLSLSDKQVGVHFGFKVRDEIVANCGVAGASLDSSNAGGTSYFQLSNGSRYSATNGGSVPANGEVGEVDGTCRSGLNGSEACGTTGLSRYDVQNSRGTSDFYVTGASIYRSVTVGGYGTTGLYLNASGGLTADDGLDNCATTFSVTETAQFA